MSCCSSPAGNSNDGAVTEHELGSVTSGQQWHNCNLNHIRNDFLTKMIKRGAIWIGDYLCVKNKENRILPVPPDIVNCTCSSFSLPVPCEIQEQGIFLVKKEGTLLPILVLGAQSRFIGDQKNSRPKQNQTSMMVPAKKDSSEVPKLEILPQVNTFLQAMVRIPVFYTQLTENSASLRPLGDYILQWYTNGNILPDCVKSLNLLCSGSANVSTALPLMILKNKCPDIVNAMFELQYLNVSSRNTVLSLDIPIKIESSNTSKINLEGAVLHHMLKCSAKSCGYRGSKFVSFSTNVRTDRLSIVRYPLVLAIHIVGKDFKEFLQQTLDFSDQSSTVEDSKARKLYQYNLVSAFGFQTKCALWQALWKESDHAFSSIWELRDHKSSECTKINWTGAMKYMQSMQSVMLFYCNKQAAELPKPSGHEYTLDKPSQLLGHNKPPHVVVAKNDKHSKVPEVHPVQITVHAKDISNCECTHRKSDSLVNRDSSAFRQQPDVIQKTVLHTAVNILRERKKQFNEFSGILFAAPTFHITAL